MITLYIISIIIFVLIIGKLCIKNKFWSDKILTEEKLGIVLLLLASEIVIIIGSLFYLP